MSSVWPRPQHHQHHHCHHHPLPPPPSSSLSPPPPPLSLDQLLIMVAQGWELSADSSGQQPLSSMPSARSTSGKEESPGGSCASASSQRQASHPSPYSAQRSPALSHSLHPYQRSAAHRIVASMGSPPMKFNPVVVRRVVIERVCLTLIWELYAKPVRTVLLKSLDCVHPLYSILTPPPPPPPHFFSWTSERQLGEGGGGGGSSWESQECVWLTLLACSRFCSEPCLVVIHNPRS